MVIHTVAKCDLNAIRVVSAYRRIRERLAAEEVVDFERVLIAETAKATSMSPERVRAIVSEWIETRPLRYLRSCLFSGVPQLFAGLQRAGKKIGIFSEYPATEKLAAMGLAANHVVAASDIGLLKPHPGGLQSLMAAASATARETLCIGDRVDRDGVAGQRAGAQNINQIFETNRGLSDFQDVSRSTVQSIHAIALASRIAPSMIAKPSYCKWRDIGHPRGENQPGHHRRRNRPWSDIQPTAPLAEGAQGFVTVIDHVAPLYFARFEPGGESHAQVRFVGGIFGRRPVLDRGRGTNQVEPMTYTNIPGALGALVTSDDAPKPEQVRRCRARDCRGRYYEPPPYYWAWGSSNSNHLPGKTARKGALLRTINDVDMIRTSETVY